nr:hypothetical protein [uncultured Oscillibacter sp.]
MEYHAKSRHWNCVCSSGKEPAGNVKYFLQTNFSSPEYSFKITLAKHSYVWYTISDIIPLGSGAEMGRRPAQSIDFQRKPGIICDMDGVICHGSRIPLSVPEFLQ